MKMRRTYALLLLATLGACRPSEDEPGPGGVSVEDARALDKAATKLDGEGSADPTADARAD